MTLKTYKLKTPADLDNWLWFRSLRPALLTDDPAARTVAKVIRHIRDQGDRALVRYMRRWTDPKFTAAQIPVPPDQLDTALQQLDPTLRRDLENAIDHVRAYQRHVLPTPPKNTRVAGAELGLRFTPIQRVGLLVPGGRAAYPSTVIMLAVPALVAGVPPEGITIVTPPPTRPAPQPSTPNQSKRPNKKPAPGTPSPDAPPTDVSPIVLAACAMLGVRNVFRVGGAQAVAALALGTQSIPPVDLIAGPGNVYTQLAKLQLHGLVGIDGYYGPSEIVTLADHTANPHRVAADLIAQAEHDPGRCVLIAWQPRVITAVNQALRAQLATRARKSAIQKSLKEWSAALLVPDPETAALTADRLAAEHVNLAVAKPKQLLAQLKHGGEFFLGDQTPVAAGDYWAGPSHCLPTGTTARFASGVSVHTFLKRSGTVHYPNAMPKKAIDAIARLARAEGLDGHAASVLHRRQARL